ncbi:MAG: site-2 protease family protein [Thermomicrobiales bacterium]
MGFSPFILISLFYAAVGIRVVVQLVQRRREIFDTAFTPYDRSMVDQAAFFILVPVSVVLHELGHAVTVWGLGGQVVDFGFYGFAGYVSFYPDEFTPAQRILIAAAGSIVNLVLILIALAVVFLRKPPLRAAYNELLLQFAFISGINAFIFYPLLDLVSTFEGDWRQMYDGGVPALSMAIGIVHIAILGGGYWLARNPRMKARMAALTDVPPGYERGMLGGVQPSKLDLSTLSPAERTLREAAERVAGGWDTRVETGVQRFNGGSAVTLAWRRGRSQHIVAARTFANGSTDLIAIPTVPPNAPNATPVPRSLYRWPATPNADDLTMGLRMAMESVDREG